MPKYDAIARYLTDQSESISQLPLTFAELERKSGCTLPPTARVERPWWANTLRNPQGRAWLTAGWRVAVVKLGEERVTFARNGQPSHVPDPQPRRRAYAALEAFFCNLPNSQQQIALTFDELERHSDRQLPPIARRDRPWWANNAASPQAVWMRAGWRVDQVFLASHTIVFRRLGSDVARHIRHLVRRLLNGEGLSSGVPPEQMKEQLAFCRRAGWYFEGTVLYERAGTMLESLGDSDRATIEEDYQVCRRELQRWRR